MEKDLQRTVEEEEEEEEEDLEETYVSYLTATARWKKLSDPRRKLRHHYRTSSRIDTSSATNRCDHGAQA
eukprot:5493388-Amphidinium_carterae.1